MKTNNVIYWKWAVLLLLILNMTTIGSIFYHNYKEKNDNAETIVNSGGVMLNGRFFRHTIGFDETQMEQFREANHTFNPVMNDLILKIDTLKGVLFDELNKPQPDTLITEKISNEIGVLHAELKKNTNAYYLKVKSIASEKQQNDIRKAFLPLFKDENVQNYRGNGQGRGYGRGYRGRRN